MTDREKMVALVTGAHNAVTDKAIENHSTFGMSYGEQIETEADYLLANGVTFQKWIPVSERLPEEHESIFKKFYGTNKWTSAMFQTVSDNVLAVVSHKDGSKTVKTMCTLDGEWRIADGRPWNITHWMPLPEPPKENK